MVARLNLTLTEKPSGRWVGVVWDEIHQREIVVHADSRWRALNALTAEIVTALGDTPFEVSAITEEHLKTDAGDTTTPLGYYWHVWPDDFDLGMSALASGFAPSYAAAVMRAREVAENIEQYRDGPPGPGPDVRGDGVEG